MGLGAEDAEDALSGMAVAVFSATAGGLRDVQSDVPLAAWLRGALMNSLKRIRRQSARAFRSPDGRCRADVFGELCTVDANLRINLVVSLTTPEVVP